MRLRLAQRDPRLRRDVEVRLPAGATVGDLLAALGSPDAPALAAPGGRRLAPDVPLADAGLVDGDTVTTAPGTTPADPRTILAPDADAGCMAVTGGPDAARRLALPPGGGTVGSSPGAELPLADPAVSPLHALLHRSADGTVVLRDLGTRNGTFVGARRVRGHATASPGDGLRFGASRCRVEPEPPAAPAAAAQGGRPARPAGRRSRVSPPRPLPSGPQREPLPAPASTLGAAGIVVPLALGLVLGWLFSPMFALFALLGPAVAGTQWLDDRRRQRRAGRVAEQAFARELADYEDELARWRAGEVARSHAADPDPATLTGWLIAVDRRCWSRAAPDDDLLRFRIGTGPGTLGATDGPESDPGPAGPEPEVADLLRRSLRVDDLPVTADLRTGEGLAVAGPAEIVRGVLRSVLLQAAVLAPPSKLAIAVVTDEPDRWQDAAWLPHARAGDTPLVIVPGDAARLTTLSGRPVLVVVDADRPVPLGGDTSSPALHVVARVPTASDAPPSCGHLLELSTSSAAVLRAVEGGAGQRLLADGVRPEVFGAAARVLAGWDSGAAGSGSDDPVDLGELLGPAGLSPDDVLRRWEQHDHRLTAPLGRGDDGPVLLDLVTDGPHALVAGTTGAGKSELLRTLVVGLALSCPPERLTFLLLDFKGGSTFDACLELPHTTDVVTDLDGRGAARALTCLRAEVRRREHVLRGVGARDHREHVRGGGDLPALVIVVDEFAVLAEEHPDVLGSLVDVARRGRSLGIHLVLATQRPSGAVTPEIRANTAIRICLRVEDPAEARDVVDDPRPARFPRTSTGMALLRVGGAGAIQLRTACVGLDATGPTVAPLVSGTGGAVSAAAPDPAALVRTCRAAADAATRRCAPSPLPPALPAEVAPDDLPATDGALAVGLVDRPRQQRREPLRWDLRRGPLLGLGLDAWRVPLAAGVAVAAGSRDTHLQVLACGTALDDLAEVPHTGSVVHAGEWDRLERLLRHLASGDHHRPTVLLFDDLPGLLRRLDDPRDLPLRTAVELLVTEGHECGVHVAAGVPNAATAPTQLLGPGALLLAGHGVDRHDAAALGIGAIPAPESIERHTVGPEGDEVLLLARGAVPAPAVLAAETEGAPPFHSPATPAEVELEDLVPATDLTGDRWLLPVGLDHGDLSPARLPLREGSGALVAGPPRSGRSSVLGVVSSVVRRNRPDMTITVLAPGRSAVPGVEDEERVDTPAAAAERCRCPGTHLLLVDDAERCADSPELDDLLTAEPSGLRVVAAGRTDRLRTIHSGWLGELRRERCGLALSPDPLADGAIWDTVLPRRTLRGSGPTAELLVDGTAVRVLLARA